MGIPLYNIPQVRRFYNKDAYGKDKIDFMTVRQIILRA
jgi:hypothetical protein